MKQTQYNLFDLKLIPWGRGSLVYFIMKNLDHTVTYVAMNSLLLSSF